MESIDTKFEELCISIMNLLNTEFNPYTEVCISQEGFSLKETKKYVPRTAITPPAPINRPKLYS